MSLYMIYWVAYIMASNMTTSLNSNPKKADENQITSPHGHIGYSQEFPEYKMHANKYIQIIQIS